MRPVQGQHEFAIIGRPLLVRQSEPFELSQADVPPIGPDAAETQLPELLMVDVLDVHLGSTPMRLRDGRTGRPSLDSGPGHAVCEPARKAVYP
jgi:hypothetical protein